MMHRWGILLLLSAVSCVVLPAYAGSISGGLASELDALPEGGKTTVLVVMEEQAPIAAMSRDLSNRDATRAERHEEIIRALQEMKPTQDGLLGWLDGALRSGAVDGYTSYWIVNSMVVRGTESAIRAIAARPDVAQVRCNPVAELVEPVGPYSTEGLRDGIGVTPGQRAIRADQVWYEYGITGLGRIVANQDTGVDGTHPALIDRWRGHNGHPHSECWLDTVNEPPNTFPEDNGSHGTHVMGSITGAGHETGDTVGVAWGAQWIACNTIGQGASGGFDNDVIESFQWFTDPDGDPSTIDDVPDVVQNSWRVNEDFPGYEDCDDRWWDVIDNCEAAGVVVIFSAGNEGPDPETIGSPPDRTTTPVNCFAVGAVDATNNDWPYPIAGFSSRGPSGCEGNATKPEVVAPGVDVYSSVPGGGYQGNGWNGTSMSGPHVAGIVGLMREANPDLEVDVIKQILLDTARDEGDPGDDNDYGWGFVDAYAAVTIALEGTGVLEGNVYNASDGGTPLIGASIGLTGSAAHYPTDEDGYYRGRAIGGTYTATATHPSFAPATAEVTIEVDQVSMQDFSLVDIVGPVVSDVSDPGTIPDETGPYTMQATITDFGAVADAKIWYRVNSGGWLEAPMSGVDDLYSGDIPGQIAGSTIDFYIEARDAADNIGLFPPDSPASYRTFYITIPVLVDDAESDHGWMFNWFGDTATSGTWIREDPVGTMVGAQPGQPEDDHTEDPGCICFVTANADPGDPPGTADVDGGCTSLVSPTIDLEDAQEVFVYYSRWFGQFGLAGDYFKVQASANNGGVWTDIEVLDEVENEWTEVLVNITDYIEPTSTVRLRFTVCDVGFDSTIEGAVDDVSVEILPAITEGVPIEGDASRAFLAPARPNPSASNARIVFRLATPGEATLDLFDANGRHIRRLLDEELTAGSHEVVWDGVDDAGRTVSAGVYYYRLKVGAFEQSSRLSFVR